MITRKMTKELGHKPSSEERRNLLRVWDRDDKSAYILYNHKNYHLLKEKVFYELTPMQNQAIDELCEWVRTSPKHSIRLGRFETKFPHQFTSRGLNYIAFPMHYLIEDRLESEDVFHELRHAKDYDKVFEENWKSVQKYRGLEIYFIERRAVIEQKKRGLEFVRKFNKKAPGISVGDYDFDHVYIYPFEEALTYLIDAGVDLKKILENTDSYLKALDEAYFEKKFHLDTRFLMENNLDRYPILNELEGEFLVLFFEGLRRVKIYRKYVLQNKSRNYDQRFIKLLHETHPWKILTETYNFKTDEDDFENIEKITQRIIERFPELNDDMKTQVN